MALIDYKKAAELLGVQVGTLYSWVHTRRVPHVRLGARLVRFDEAELMRWIAERRVPPSNIEALDGS